MVPVPLPPPPSKLPSVAILPFANLNANAAHDHLAEGIVEDVIASLAALREVFVIAADFARMFRGTRPDPLRVGRTLGVRYVVSGSLLRDGDRLVVSVQLSDTLTGETLWGERIEAATREIFDVQDTSSPPSSSGSRPTCVRHRCAKRCASGRRILRRMT